MFFFLSLQVSRWFVVRARPDGTPANGRSGKEALVKSMKFVDGLSVHIKVYYIKLLLRNLLTQNLSLILWALT